MRIRLAKVAAGANAIFALGVGGSRTLLAVGLHVMMLCLTIGATSREDLSERIAGLAVKVNSLAAYS